MESRPLLPPFAARHHGKARRALRPIGRQAPNPAHWGSPEEGPARLSSTVSHAHWFRHHATPPPPGTLSPDWMATRKCPPPPPFISGALGGSPEMAPPRPPSPSRAALRRAVTRAPPPRPCRPVPPRCCPGAAAARKPAAWPLPLGQGLRGPRGPRRPGRRGAPSRGGSCSRAAAGPRSPRWLVVLPGRERVVQP